MTLVAVAIVVTSIARVWVRLMSGSLLWSRLEWRRGGAYGEDGIGVDGGLERKSIERFLLCGIPVSCKRNETGDGLDVWAVHSRREEEGFSFVKKGRRGGKVIARLQGGAQVRDMLEAIGWEDISRWYDHLRANSDGGWPACSKEDVGGICAVQSPRITNCMERQIVLL